MWTGSGSYLQVGIIGDCLTGPSDKMLQNDICWRNTRVKERRVKADS